MLSFHSVHRIACFAALLAANSLASGQECSPGPDNDAFGVPGTDWRIHGLTTWDDGTGPDLVAVGSFWSAGSNTAFHVARWDGDGWKPFGDYSVPFEIPETFNLNSNFGISTIVYDDGSGPALYVGGQFEWIGPDGTSVKHLAKWDGERWVQVPVTGPVYRLRVEDFGSGPELLATGKELLPIQSGLSRNLGAWDGTQWRRFPELPRSVEFGDYVYGGVLFSGTGDRELYVITNEKSFILDGSSMGRLYRLGKDNTWGVVDDSTKLLNSTSTKVTALEVHDDGTGEALYLGGRGFVVDGSPIPYGIVRWDGEAWSAMEGFGNPGPVFRWVRNLRSIQRNGASELVATGNFSPVFGSPFDAVAIYRDGSWSTPGAGELAPDPARSYVDLYASCVLPMNGTDELVVAGLLSGAGGLAASNIARWDGAAWQPLQDPSPDELVGTVKTMAEVVLDDAPALVVGGQITNPDQPDSRSIAALNDGGWAWLGDGFDLEVRVTASVDHGGGPELYAGGLFRFSGDTPVSRVARWDSASKSWAPLGTGLNNGAAAVIGYDSKLVVGGSFTQAGGAAASHIAQWDGSSWSPLAGTNGGSLNGPVLALSRYDDGSGEALYAGGSFQQADGQPAIGIARWDGASWSPLIGTNGGGLNGPVRSMRVFDSGSGPELIVAGTFSEADGLVAENLARWNGFEWMPIDCAEQLDTITALEVFDDGSGQALYIGGFIVDPGGPFQGPSQVGRVLKWQGDECEPIDLEVTGPVNALRASTVGPAPSLYIGGDFDYYSSGGEVARSANILRWTGCTPSNDCPPDVSGDGSIDLADLNLVLANFGQTTDAGDTNGDGEVDLADLNAVLGAFGQACP